jgi:hypothetical protein
MSRESRDRPSTVGPRGCAVFLASLAVALIFGVISPSATYAPQFAGPRNYTTGEGPFSVATGDLNGDGSLDLATANYGGTVSVLLNQGDGNFRPKLDLRITTTTAVDRGVAIGDLNGDGKPDLVTANYSPYTVSVFVNRGDGSFQDKVDYETGRFPSPSRSAT